MFARVIRAAALLLLAGQAIIAQAHLHAPARSVAMAVAVALSAEADMRSTPVPERSDGLPDCPVCREIGHAGPYHPPAELVAHVPTAIGLWVAACASSHLLHQRRSHDWRSRAPPALLPA